jgi:hypothetical protein
MPSDEELGDFLMSSFRSVWTLETLLLVARDPSRCWSHADLVAALRASDLIVDKAVGELEALGLLAPDREGFVRYCPASPDLAALVVASQELYARSPGSVRRLIVGAGQSSVTAFADAFRFRREDL